MDRPASSGWFPARQDKPAAVGPDTFLIAVDRFQAGQPDVEESSFSR
jgi:hypothetical protein